MQKVKFPVLRTILAEEFRRKSYTLRDAASELRVSPATLNAWRQGRTFPRAPLVLRLASLFYEPGTSEHSELLASIRAARQSALATTPSDFRQHGVRVSYLSYPPLCWRDPHRPESGERGFLSQLVGQIFALGRIKQKPVWRESVAETVMDLKTSQSDLGLCLFDTVDRSVDLYCLQSPCRITLNALYLRRESETVDTGTIRKCLTLTREKFPDGPRLIRPLAFIEEVGHCFLRDSLHFPENDVVKIPRLDAFEAAQTLETPSREQRPTVLVADEFTILRVLAELRTPASRKAARLVFPLATQGSALTTKRDVPAYVVGIGSVNHGQTALIEYLRKVLTLLLQTEIESVAAAYRGLLEGMETTARRGLGTLEEEATAELYAAQQEPSADESMWKPACAARAARYALRLNPEDDSGDLDTLNLHWAHILRRVRQQIGPVREGMESPREGRFRLGIRPHELFCKAPPPKNSTGLGIEGFGFLGEVLKPLAGFVDLTNVQVLKEISLEASTDLRIGLFETLDRALKWQYFSVPVRLGLNAVALIPGDREEAQARRYKLVNALSPNPSKRSQWSPGVKPVVLLRGSAWEYVHHTLGYSNESLSIVTVLDSAAYCKELTNPGPGETRVAVVDALTCLRVLEKDLEGSELLFPLFQPGGIPSCLPEYGMGIAVNRASREWVEFFNSAFPLMLCSNRGWLEDCVVRLRDDLTKLIADRLSGIAAAAPGRLRVHESDLGSATWTTDVARQWVNHALFLTHRGELPERYRCWAPILARIGGAA